MWIKPDNKGKNTSGMDARKYGRSHFSKRGQFTKTVMA